MTTIGETAATAAEIAGRINSSGRGVHILCDYLAMLEFLSKEATAARLTPDSAAFLNRKSPTYAVGMTKLLRMPDIAGTFDDLSNAVRNARPRSALYSLS